MAFESPISSREQISVIKYDHSLFLSLYSISSIFSLCRAKMAAFLEPVREVPGKSVAWSDIAELLHSAIFNKNHAHGLLYQWVGQETSKGNVY